jgi:2-dehydropantoate 2-reductase
VPDREPHAYTVVGAGAVGGTLAYHLARAGHHVTLVDADPAHVSHIASSGITLLRDGRRDSVAVDRVLTPQDALPGRAGRVLLAVKAQHTETAMRWVARQLADRGFVVSLQNGLNEMAVADAVGRERTVGAFVNLFADVVGPGEIRDGGAGALVVGEVDGRVSSRVRSVVDDLQAWGPARATTNVHGYLWSKLGFGAMLVATALADDAMADLIDRHRAVMHGLVGEVFTVAAAERIRLEAFDAFDPAPYADGGARARDLATDRLVAWLRTQGKDRSGFWRDLAVRRRATEVPAHYEPVLRTAHRHGIACPLLEQLLDHVAALEQGARMGEQRLRELATRHG